MANSVGFINHLNRIFMSNTDNTLKNPEEEEDQVTEEATATQSTDLQLKPDAALTETIEVLSETKVRHDTVK